MNATGVLIRRSAVTERPSALTENGTTSHPSLPPRVLPACCVPFPSKLRCCSGTSDPAVQIPTHHRFRGKGSLLTCRHREPSEADGVPFRQGATVVHPEQPIAWGDKKCAGASVQFFAPPEPAAGGRRIFAALVLLCNGHCSPLRPTSWGPHMESAWPKGGHDEHKPLLHVRRRGEGQQSP